MSEGPNTYLEENKGNPAAIGGLLDLSQPTGVSWFFENIVDVIESEHVEQQATTRDFLPAHDVDECGICLQLVLAGLVS